MLTPPPPLPPLDYTTRDAYTLAAAKAFQPRSPISTRQLFAGRWDQITTVADAVSQTGLHIVIFGERGVGKTSLSNVIGPVLNVLENEVVLLQHGPRLVVKVNTHSNDRFADVWVRAFSEISWEQDKPVIGLIPQTVTSRISLYEALRLSDAPSIDEVRRTLAILPRSVFIFDEFDRGSAELSVQFTDLIKSLSDYAVDSTVIIVGVSDTVDHLIRDHASIGRAIVQIALPRMDERELAEILMNGAKSLGMSFDRAASDLIVRLSQGLPHYTHLIGLHAIRESIMRLSPVVTLADVHASFQKAIKQAVQTIQQNYSKAVHSARKDTLYEHVILACASASSCARDALGYFYPGDVVEPASIILKRDTVTIATFQKHINEFCEEDRGPILEREGSPRTYKYRFRDPLLPPYIFITAIANKTVDMEQLHALWNGSRFLSAT